MTDHAALIVVANWRCHKIEVSLCCSSARGSRVQVETSTSQNRCLILEVELCCPYRHIIRTLPHIVSIVRIICLEVLQSHFLGLYTLGVVLLLDSI